MRFSLVDGALTDAAGRVWTVTETALVGPAGERLARLTEGFVAFWFAWSVFYPATDVYDGSEPDPILELDPDPDAEPQRIDGFGADSWGRIKEFGAGG